MTQFKSENSIWYRVIHYGFEFLGRFYSSYRGFVIDNNDPDGMNRVKVIIPSIKGNDGQGIWAYPKHSWGGKDYGVNLLPQNKDMVWIEFEMGDLEHPIWSHASYGLEEKPEEFINPNIYGFKTPQKNLVLIDDGENGKILVQYKTKEEYIQLTKETVELEAKKLIKLGKNGDEKAAMGETTKNKINDLCNIVKEVLSDIASHTHPSDNTPTTTASNFTAKIEQISSIQESLGEMLSNKVKLDR